MVKKSIVFWVAVSFLIMTGTVMEPSAQGSQVKMTTLPFKSGVSVTLATIPAGSFRMGSEDREEDERPVHTVTLDAFEISATEITQGQYREITGGNPSHFTGDDRLPVDKVTWQDAVRFCNKLSDREGMERCYDEKTWACDFSKNGFRLPTEAEWEYACRAGTSTKYYTGDTEQDLARAGWYGYDAGNSSEKTHPVGQKEPNTWGLYDMHGNILEWTHDGFSDYSAEPQANPTGPDKAEYCVLRGGSWFSTAPYCTSTFRINDKTNRTSYFTGFRIARRG